MKINRCVDSVGDALELRYEHLRCSIKKLGSVAVAFSGGVDSSLVLKVSVDVLGRDNAVAVTGRSPSLSGAEDEHAQAVAHAIGAEHVILETNEFDNPSYTSNPTNRCYFCKSTLYQRMQRFIEDRGVAHIVSGTNADDKRDHRPGLVAAREFRVREPLADAGITKQDVRRLAVQLGLPNHDKPASPCLSSRIPYGESVTVDKLRMIEQAESVLHGLGFRQCRVRHHTNTARIEVPLDELVNLVETDMATQVEERLRVIGYEYVTVDLAGFRSGRLNEVISLGVIA